MVRGANQHGEGRNVGANPQNSYPVNTAIDAADLNTSSFVRPQHAEQNTNYTTYEAREHYELPGGNGHEWRCGCTLTYDTKARLSRHIAKETGRFLCLECNNKSGSKDDLDRHRREMHQKGKEGEPVPSFFCQVPGCRRNLRGFARKANMEEHGRRMHPGLSDSISTMNRFSVNSADFGTALPNSIANHNQQDMDPYDYSFHDPGKSSHIGDDIGFDSMPPLNPGFSLVPSQSTDQEASYGYPDYMPPNTLGPTISNDDRTARPTAIYDPPGQAVADREPEEPIQASSHSGHRPDEDKIRKRIIELEDRKRVALLMVENMDSELTTLKKANDILRSYARS